MKMLLETQVPTENSEATQAKAALTKHDADIAKLNTDNFADLVGVCKVKKAMDKPGRSRKMRLIFALDTSALPATFLTVPASDAELAIKVLLHLQGASRSVGPPPPSMLEKAVSLKLTKLQQKK